MRLATNTGWPTAPNAGRPIAALQPDLLPLFVLAACWLAMTLVANPLGNFPLNDDWVYAQAVQSVLETGVYRFPSATSANVGPQVYWGALFCIGSGFSFTALRISTVTLGFIGVVILYMLARDIMASRRAALLAALTMAVNPFYVALSNSFMTDVPFVVLTLASASVLLKGLRTESQWRLVTGVGLALAAILVRQLGVVILVAFAVAWVVKHGWSVGRVVRGALLVMLGIVVHFGYQRWMLQTGRVPMLTVHASVSTLIPTASNAINMLKTATASLLYAGFLLAPFMVQFWFARRTDGARRNGRLVLYCAVPALMLFFGLWAIDKLLPAAGNVLIPSGVGPLLQFDTYVLHVNHPVVTPLVKIIWGVVTLLSVAAIFTVAYFLASNSRNKPRSGLIDSRFSNEAIAFFATLVLVYFLILVLITGRVYIFDRYFLFFLPPGVLLVCCLPQVRALQVPRAGLLAATLAIALMGAFSAVATHDYLAFNRSKWAALRDLMGQGKVPVNKIDGGYEFNGWYSFDAHYKEQSDKSWWWVVDNEYIVTAGPIPNYTEVRRYSFQRWLSGTKAHILVVRRNGAEP